jgi:Arc/MetJ-type ribon-helix-helix transcriptional regulator
VRVPETEKLTINVTPVDLGRMELLVDQGFYANRAEFIRTAIHHQLEKHTDTVRETSAREGLVIGAMTFGRAQLERHRKAGKRMSIKVIGYLSIADDVTPSLASQVIESLTVRGVFRASPEVKAALAERMG